MAKDEEYIRLIHATRWLKLRKQVLTLHPLCERCLEKERVTPATEVHHVVPVESAASAAEKRRLMYDAANLKALCHACHVAEHVAMGRGGRKANAERQRKKAAEVIERFFHEGRG